MTPRSPLDDLDSRKARLRQRIPEIAPNATHEYLTVDGVRFLDVPHAEAEASPLGAAPSPDDPRWVPLEPGEAWGRGSDLLVWGYPGDGGNVTWLHARVSVPPGWADDDVLLGLDDPRLGEDRAAVDGIGFEGLVHLDGRIHAGMDDWHREVLLPADCAGRDHDVLIRATTASRRPFAGLRLLRRDRATWRLGTLARSLLDVAEVLGDDDVIAIRIRERLDTLYRVLDLSSGWNHPVLRRSAAAALPTLTSLAGTLAEGSDGDRPTVTAIGHAHLDVAWLWPVWRTRQKVAHTVATALNLMDRYPDYHFGLSAPQTWLFLEQDAPELFSRMVERAREGRLEPVGVFWLESDGQLPSGESFVRQLHHGSRFYRTRLGQVPNAAWLPDSFGFTAALPTILSAFGVRALLTTKMSWNRTNRMPNDTFLWRGPDGSTVVAHFVTASSAPVDHPADPMAHTYNGDMTAAEVDGLWRHYRNKDVSDELLYLYGYGDGGGGPTEAMVARAEAMADVAHFPQVRLGRAHGFFERLLAATQANPRLPTWSGDLYMEGHRGTLTSQQRTKRGNRDGELALREAEWANAWAVLDGAGDRQSELDAAWETLLRNQFHDILPGSGIPRVPADAALDHAEVLRTARSVRDAALGAGAQVVNALPWDRTGVVQTPDGATVLATAPSWGLAPLPVSGGDGGAATVRVRPDGDGFVLGNGIVEARFDARLELVSLRELASGVEAVAPGEAANRLVVYEDRPLYWDAWDVDPFYADKPTPVDAVESVEAFGDGSPRAGVRVHRRIGASSLVQTLTLDAGGARLDVLTEVDWHERNRLLRAVFPFSPNARTATVGRQFGSVELPVHRNTSWERARFELAAHGWCDVSDGGGGVALLTDAIYGHSVLGAADGVGTTVGLSLLKSGAWPDPHADEGTHRLRYALLPHAGTWQAASVPRAALDLAVPLRVTPSSSPDAAPDAAPDGAPGAAPQGRGLLSVTGDHVVAETLKAAWDGDGVVVRLFEAHNSRGPVRLTFDRPPTSVHRCDAAEQDGEPLPVDGTSVDLVVGPHELVTLRARFPGTSQRN